MPLIGQNALKHKAWKTLARATMTEVRMWPLFLLQNHRQLLPALTVHWTSEKKVLS